MKYITKNYAKKHEQVQFIYSLLDLKAERGKIKRKSYETDEKINCKILRDLPKEIYNNLKDKESILSGYVCKEDNELLSTYAFYLLKDLEKRATKANKITEMAEKTLPKQFILDDVVGEVLYSIYEDGKRYYLEIGNRKICVDNYEIIKSANAEMKKITDKALKSNRVLYGAELRYIKQNSYELYLLFVSQKSLEEKEYFEIALKGTSVEYIY